MNKLEELSKEDYDEYSLKEIYEEMELMLVSSFRRNIVKHIQEEIDLGFSWEMWQAALLRDLERYRKETLKLVDGYSKEVEKVVDEVLEKSFDKGMDIVEKRAIAFPEDKMNVGKVGKKPPAETKFFQVNERKMKALTDSVKSDVLKAQHSVVRKMDDVYKEVIFKTEFQLSAGAISLTKAIDQASKEFLSKGIDCVQYSNGRKVNIATYTEMALRTASQRATFLGEGTKRDEMGIHLVLVSVHAQACELCLPYQGEILIDDVFSHPSEEYKKKYKQYDLLSDAIKKGFLHPNCRHTLITYFEGVTRIPDKIPDEIVLKNNQLEKKQRQLETKIRTYKRLAQGTVDQTEQKQYRAVVRDTQKELRQLIDSNKDVLKRDGRRERVYAL